MVPILLGRPLVFPDCAVASAAVRRRPSRLRLRRGSRHDRDPPVPPVRPTPRARTLLFALERQGASFSASDVRKISPVRALSAHSRLSLTAQAIDAYSEEHEVNADKRA